MKILIEESVLRQALETFTHCYAETDRRINERAKLLVELRTVLDAAEKVEPIFWYRPLENGCYEGPKHNSQMEKVRKTSGVWVPLYTHPAPTTLVDSLAEKIAIATREIEGWKAVADAGEKIIAARDEQIAELEEKIKQQIRFRGEALRERDELVAALKKMNRAYVNLMENGRNRIIMLGGDCDPVDIMEHHDPYLRESRAALAKLGADKTGEK